MPDRRQIESNTIDQIAEAKLNSIEFREGDPENKEILLALAKKINEKYGKTLENASSKSEESFPKIEITASQPEQKESIKDKRISLVEGFKLAGLDLNKELENAIKRYDQAGLVQALIDLGVAKDYDAIGQKFDKATVSKKDMMTAKQEYVDKEKSLIVLFDPLGNNAEELKDKDETTGTLYWKVLFEQMGIPYWEDTYGLNNLNQIRQINPSDIPDLKNLHKKSLEEQEDAFQKAYKKAGEQKIAGPRVLITPDTQEIIKGGTSATEDMQSQANSGNKILDINGNLLRFYTQLIRGLEKIAEKNNIYFDKLDKNDFKKFMQKCFNNKSQDEFIPDIKKYTRSSNSVYPNGGVAGLGWLLDYRKVILDVYVPDDACVSVGSRLVLG